MTRRRWRLAGLIAGAAVVAVALAGIPLYVLPASDDPGPVDVVYVIGPPTDARIEVALDMVSAGDTNAVMVSLDLEEEGEYPGAARLCHGVEDDSLPTDPWLL